MISGKLKIPYMLLLFFLLLAASCKGYAQSSEGIIVINSSSEIIDAKKSGRVKILKHENIADWAQARGFELIPDRGPVLNNSAFYFMDFRGVFNISGLSRHKRYILRIDFVKFKKTRDAHLSYIKLFIRDKNGEEHLISALDKNELYNEKIFETSLPFRFTYEESFELIMYEYSEIPGSWGIWDIIIYPENSDINTIEAINPATSEKSMKHDLKILD